MKIVPVKTPSVAKKMFPNYVWNMATPKKELYLTFDDGPTPEITNFVLDTLKKHNAKATFFCIGVNIEKYPGIFQDILNDGHSIGNHTQHHSKGWKTKTKDYLREVEQTQNTIKKFQNITSEVQKEDNQQSPHVNLFRPPYGQIKPKQGKKLIVLGYKIIMWDVLSFDWEKEVPEEQCLENVVSKSKPGSIIVFHDSLKASKNMMYALPKVLDALSKKGFEFKALSF